MFAFYNVFGADSIPCAESFKSSRLRSAGWHEGHLCVSSQRDSVVEIVGSEQFCPAKSGTKFEVASFDAEGASSTDNFSFGLLPDRMSDRSNNH